MDPALLQEREAFKKRAMAVPTIEKRSKAETSSHREVAKPKVRSATAAPKLDANNYKSMSGSSQYRFGVLAKIVRHMKNRHLDGDDHALTLDDILDETNQLDVGNSVRTWLATEALQNNPKIEVSRGGQNFSYKPVYKLKDGKSLVRLLKQQDLKGLGGVMLDDIQESLPHCEKVLKHRANEIVYIVRPTDKKKIMFYNDKSSNMEVDDEFVKLWRSVTVDAMDDAKIDEYLEKQGIRTMQDHGPKKMMAMKRKKGALKKRQFKKPRDNEHLAHVLEVYEDNTITQAGVSIKQ